MFFLVRHTSSHAIGTTQSYATGVNQQGIVMLDDGTRVTLAPQTMLRLIGFSKQNRMVFVDGKAYFEVSHTAGAPFEVRGGSVTARVLGTAFLVDHAPHSTRVRVGVEEGKIRVINASRASEARTITAGYVGEFTDSLTTVTAVIDSAPGTEWLHGKLVFYNTPVAVVLRTLSRWYGFQFRCADSTLPERNVTIGLSARSSASTLATLEQILSVNLTIVGDTVTLIPLAEQRTKGTPRIRSYDIWTPTREVGR
jgi:transmembrane sensor